jgi:hypothetical protein
MPRGIPYIVGNEAAERYSYYGMRAILVIFMTRFLMNAQGELEVMTDEQAKTWFHVFVTAVYFFPIFGAIISDAFFGKYRTIMALSIVYCLGHLTLAIDDTRTGLALGLGLIAIGSGGIKPCVSAHVGDQFGQTNAQLLPKIFGWFYFSINVGALTSILFAEPLLHRFGPSVAFGVPGVLMGLATLVFWMGRDKFVHIQPGGVAFLREVFSGEGLSALGKLFIIYTFIAMFWALFDQQGSAWVLQAARMDRHFIVDWDPSQAQWLNPALVLLAADAAQEDLDRAVLDRTGVPTAGLAGGTPRRGRDRQHRMAARRLHPHDCCGDSRFDHRVGVFLHSGSEANEVPGDGRVLDERLDRKLLHRRCELLHSESRRHQQARRILVLHLLCRSDGGHRRALRSGRSLVQRADVHSRRSA